MANEKRLIDANALMKEHCEGCAKDVQKICKTDPVCASMMWVVEAPTVDAVEVVRGHWENLGEKTKMDLRCSVCNNRASRFVGGYEDWWDLWKPNYCPSCGAKMDGDSA